VVPRPTVIEQQRIVEVPQVMQVELINEVPRPQVQQVPKNFAKYQLQPREQIVEVPCVFRVEQPVDVPEVQHVEAITQQMDVSFQAVERGINVVRMEPVERLTEVAVGLRREVPVPVPEMQTIDQIRQVLDQTAQVVQKQVPKAQINYQEIQVPIMMSEGIPAGHVVGEQFITVPDMNHQMHQQVGYPTYGSPLLSQGSLMTQMTGEVLTTGPLQGYSGAYAPGGYIQNSVRGGIANQGFAYEQPMQPMYSSHVLDYAPPPSQGWETTVQGAYPGSGAYMPGSSAHMPGSTMMLPGTGVIPSSSISVGMPGRLR